MFNVQQQVKNPFGITVFGSAIIRVPPDVAVLNFSVSRTHPTPKEAFDTTHEGTARVRNYLAKAGVEDVQSSRVHLSAEFRYVGSESKFLGYKARTGFVVVLTDLGMLEDVLTGVVDAGANSLGSVDMQTTKLKEVRARARRQAVAAAREKAELYCEAAGVTLGDVLHIEDVNPDLLQGRAGHMSPEVIFEDDHVVKAFDPGSIAVRAAVLMAFRLE